MNKLKELKRQVSLGNDAAARNLYWDISAENSANTQNQNQDGDFMPIGSLYQKAENERIARVLLREAGISPIV